MNWKPSIFWIQYRDKNDPNSTWLTEASCPQYPSREEAKRIGRETANGRLFRVLAELPPPRGFAHYIVETYGDAVDTRRKRTALRMARQIALGVGKQLVVGMDGRQGPPSDVKVRATYYDDRSDVFVAGFRAGSSQCLFGSECDELRT